MLRPTTRPSRKQILKTIDAKENDVFIPSEKIIEIWTLNSCSYGYTFQEKIINNF